MGKINTGGPAFPFVQWRSPDGMIHSDLSAGMTLRDYFAANAPAASDERVIEEVEGFPVFDNSKYFNGFPSEAIFKEQLRAQAAWLRSARIKWRYQYADAMLAECSKGGSDA